jgi:hypothetical protein
VKDVTVAYGVFAIALVLGWAALFTGGASGLARLMQIGWAAGLVLFVLLAPDRGPAAAGVLAGGLAHLVWLLGLREQRL